MMIIISSSNISSSISNTNNTSTIIISSINRVTYETPGARFVRSHGQFALCVCDKTYRSPVLSLFISPTRQSHDDSTGSSPGYITETQTFTRKLVLICLTQTST